MAMLWKVLAAMVGSAAKPDEAVMLRGARTYLEQAFASHVMATIQANRPQVSSLCRVTETQQASLQA